MKEQNKAILGAIIFAVIIIIVIVGVIKFIVYAGESSKEYRQEQIQQIDECIQKTNDYDWCMDKFF